MTLSFVLAAVSHHLVEQPLRQVGFLKVSRRRSLVAGGVLVATSLVASLALVVSTTPPADEGSTVAAPPSDAVAGPATTGQTSEPRESSAVAPVVDPAALREPNTPEEARDSQASWGRTVLRGLRADGRPRGRRVQGRAGHWGGADHRAHRGLARDRVVPRLPQGGRGARLDPLLLRQERLPGRRRRGPASRHLVAVRRLHHVARDTCSTASRASTASTRSSSAGGWPTAAPPSSRTGRPAPRRRSVTVWRAGAERTFDRLRRVTPRIVVDGGRPVAERRRAGVPLGAPPGRRGLRLLPVPLLGPGRRPGRPRRRRPHLRRSGTST